MGFDLSGLGKKAFNVIKSGVETGVAETKKQIRINQLRGEIHSQKILLVRRFNNTRIAIFCREQGISFEKVIPDVGKDGTIVSKKVKKTIEDLVQDASKKPKEALFEFSDRYKVAGYHDIKLKILELEREIEKVRGNFVDDSVPVSTYDRIVDAIEKFKPIKRYEYENQYEIALSNYLTSLFPDSVSTQIQKGVSRPDIIIEDVAIEIKGPTNNADLPSLNDKASRYVSHFHGGLIVVLFDLHAENYYFNEWKNGFLRHFPNVKIIVK